MLYSFQVSKESAKQWHWIEEGAIVRSFTSKQVKELKKLQARQHKQFKTLLSELV